MKKYVSFWLILLSSNYYQSKSLVDRGQALFSRFLNFLLKPKTIKGIVIIFITGLGVDKIIYWTNCRYNAKINQNLNPEKIKQYIKESTDPITKNGNLSDEEKQKQKNESLINISKILKIGNRETNIYACFVDHKIYQIIINQAEYTLSPEASKKSP